MSEWKKIKLSEIALADKVPRLRREYFNKGKLSNPKFYSYANRAIRKQAI